MNSNLIVKTYLQLDKYLIPDISHIILSYVFDDDLSDRCNSITKQNLRCKRKRMELFFFDETLEEIFSITVNNCFQHLSKDDINKIDLKNF